MRAVDDIAEADAPFAPLKSDEFVSVPAPASDGKLVSPVPTDAPPMPQSHFTLGKPTARWIYRDARGATLFAVLRFDKADDNKEFWPLTLWQDAKGLQWRWKSVPAPRSLYNRDKLAAQPDAPVVVCEGEKSADAAAQIFPKSVVTTSPGGANAADKADWSVLRGRKVLIWPDDDEPGRTYAAKVGAILTAFDNNVSIVDAAALARTAPDGGNHEPTKDGWDAADAITEWADTATLRREVFKCAKPFDVAEAAPAYISFGRFTMNTNGLRADPRSS
jgi:putative DNA primase/helicase